MVRTEIQLNPYNGASQESEKSFEMEDLEPVDRKMTIKEKKTCNGVALRGVAQFKGVRLCEFSSLL